MSMSSHFNETLHALRQRIALPANMAVADDMPRVRGTLVEHRPRREREPSPYPYPDLEPSQRAFRVARRNRAIEIAEAVERKQKRNDLVARFKR